MSSPRATPWGALAVALTLYVALRGLFLYTAFDDTALPAYELYPMGTMAELAHRDVDIPLRYFYDNAAGQILMGQLTRPYFALFGPSYLALKLVPATLGFLTLVLVFGLLCEHFGRVAAVLGSVFFALAPTVLVKYSVTNSGNHFENLFFTTLAIFASYRFHKSGTRAWLVASGFTAGLALFVFLGALIPVGLLAGTHVLVRGVRRSLGDVAWAAGGFLVGIAPLVAINAATGARGLGFLGAKFGSGETGHGDALSRAVDFLFVHLPASTVFEPWAGMPARVAGLLFLAAFVVAYVPSLVRAVRGMWSLASSMGRPVADTELAQRFERAKLIPFAAYLPLAALAFGLSNLRIGGHGPPVVFAGYRYFLPHLLFATLMISIVASELWVRGALARKAGVLLAGVVLFTGLFNLAVVDWSFARTNVGSRYVGYNLAQLGRGLIAARTGLTKDEIAAHIDRLPAPLDQRVSTSIGFNLAAVQVGTNRPPPAPGTSVLDVDFGLDPILDGYPERLHGDLARGAGITLRFLLGQTEPGLRALEASLPDVARRSPRLSSLLVEGVGMGTIAPGLESNTRAMLTSSAALPPRAAPELRADLVRGAGALCGKLLARGIASERVPIEECAALLGNERSFWIGLGFGFAESFDDARPTAEFATFVPREHAADAWRGFGAALHFVHRLNVETLLVRELAPKDAELARAFAAGVAWSAYPLDD
jgi:hypothetical protein